MGVLLLEDGRCGIVTSAPAWNAHSPQEGAYLTPGCHISNPTSCSCTREAAGDSTQVFEALPPMEETHMEFAAHNFSLESPGCSRHLESELTDGSFPLSLLSLPFKRKQEMLPLEAMC